MKVRNYILIVLILAMSAPPCFADQASKDLIEQKSNRDAARVVQLATQMAQSAGVQIDPQNQLQAIGPFLAIASQQVQQERAEKNRSSGGGGGGGEGGGGNGGGGGGGISGLAAGVAAMIGAATPAVMSAINANRDKSIANTEANKDKYIADGQKEATIFGAGLGAADAVEKARASVDMNKNAQDGATQRVWLQTAAMLAIQRVKAQQEASKEQQNFSLQMAKLDMDRMQNRALNAQSNMILRGKLMLAALGNAPIGIAGNYMNRGGLTYTPSGSGVLGGIPGSGIINSTATARNGFLTSSLNNISERTRLNRRLVNYTGTSGTTLVQNTPVVTTGAFQRGGLGSFRGGSKMPYHSTQSLNQGRHGSAH